MKNNEYLAKIATNKSLLKEYSNNQYNRIVYLDNNTEFEIQLFNKYDYTIGADIYINDIYLGYKLVIRPGERIWLNRFLDNPNKFLFSTYCVDNTKKAKDAIQHNGEIKILFYKENKYYYYSYSNTNLFNSNQNLTDINIIDEPLSWDSTTVLSGCSTSPSPSVSAFNSCSCYKNSTITAANTSNKIETGRIERGNYSNQKLKNVNVNFDYFSFDTEIIKILPLSEKQFTNNDLNKKYCFNCGRKIKDKFKFCPYCGEKL